MCVCVTVRVCDCACVRVCVCMRSLFMCLCGPAMQGAPPLLPVVEDEDPQEDGDNGTHILDAVSVALQEALKQQETTEGKQDLEQDLERVNYGRVKRKKQAVARPGASAVAQVNAMYGTQLSPTPQSQHTSSFETSTELVSDGALRPPHVHVILII